MPGQQYSKDQRNFVMLEYVKVKGTRDFHNKIRDAFQVKFPNAPVPTKMTIRNIYKKQKLFGTVHNLNSKTSPGDTHSGRRKSARIQENIDAVHRTVTDDAQKDYDDPTISSCRRNDITSKSSYHRIIHLVKKQAEKLKSCKIKDKG